MGNTASTKSEAAPEPQITAISPDESYQFPENLYVESRDMVAAAFLVYSFGYIMGTARKVSIKGIDVDSAGHVSNPQNTSRLGRSFSPKQVKQIVLDNKEVLVEHFPSEFTDDSVVKSLDILIERASDNDEALALVEYDDHHQDKEMVYAVAKDDISKRITLVFRGTDNELAGMNNWKTNLSFFKEGVAAPDAVKDAVDGDEIWLHGGFYNYIFGTTATDSDAPDKRKYDEILEDIKPLLEANPGYKLYVTGHSLGAALSSVVAFYLACDDSIPKPVTCLNYASPRVGDSFYLQASTHLEKTKQLRFLRVVNDNDSIAMVPMINYYHAGLQVRLHASSSTQPEVTYPKLVDSTWNRWSRTWRNSLITSFNLSYDHGEYRERVEENRAFLESLDVNKLYNDPSLTGFSWA